MLFLNEDGGIRPDLNTLVCLDLNVLRLSEDQLKLVADADWYIVGGTVLVPGPQIKWLTNTSPESRGVNVHHKSFELVTQRAKFIMLGNVLNEQAHRERTEHEQQIKLRGRWNIALASCLALLLLATIVSGLNAPEGSIAAVFGRVAEFLLLSGILAPICGLLATKVRDDNGDSILGALLGITYAAKIAFEIGWSVAIAYFSALAAATMFVYIATRKLKRRQIAVKAQTLSGVRTTSHDESA